MKKDLRSALVDMGASEQQLSSKTFEMVERAIAEDAVDEMATATARIKKLNHAASLIEGKLAHKSGELDAQALRTKDLIEEARSVCSGARDLIGELGERVDERLPKDQNLLDAINTYTLILSRTKSVLGDDALTEAVIIQLLETASYGLWRSIMGPKDSVARSPDSSRSRKSYL